MKLTDRLTPAGPQVLRRQNGDELGSEREVARDEGGGRLIHRIDRRGPLRGCYPLCGREILWQTDGDGVPRGLGSVFLGHDTPHQRKR